MRTARRRSCRSLAAQAVGEREARPLEKSRSFCHGSQSSECSLPRSEIGTVSAPVITSGIFVTKHYAEIYGFLSLFPGVGYALGGPLIAPAYDMTGSYNIAWIIAAALSIAMTAFLLYSYRVSRICIKGQEETGNTAKIQYNNGRMR